MYCDPHNNIIVCATANTMEIFVLGNFHVTNFVLKIFVGMTPYHVNVNSARAFFVRLISVAAINYENIFTTKISRFRVSSYTLEIA